ncbi:ABC transporter transmembrane domain-containing protein [Dongia sp.]|uniref:ABC transporter transmembrane domain-containing protein n=1 Tax=Dongia sp. TaxID=1977262 RepID=UPI00375391C2
MERNLFKYIWRHSWRDQVYILAIVLLLQVFYFVSLDLPKRIVNDGIRGEAFKETSVEIPTHLNYSYGPAIHPEMMKPEGKVNTIPFMEISFGPYESIGVPKLTLFSGLMLDQMQYLFALCFAYLFFVVLNGWMKQWVNTEKGRLGERMLRRLRFELYDRILKFPLGHFRKVKQAEIATMIKDEVEPLGGFIGDAFIQPAMLAGQALTALYFIFLQNFYLGALTFAILAVQMAVIPKLRVKVRLLARQRQITARALAGRIAESVDGAIEIHTNDTSNYERADIIDRLGTIFLIRFELYKRKFFVKYLNNMLAATTPFLFYLIGGYLALNGKFDTGSLLAAINAYKDLPDPIKQLIDWDQQRQDVQIKYDQVMEQFNPDGMLPPELQAIDAMQDVDAGTLAASNLAFTDESGARLVEDVSLEIGPDAHVAVIGTGASGKEQLGLLLGRLALPVAGQLKYGEHDLTQLPESVTGRRFAYVGEESYFFPLSLRENLSYGLKHRPVEPARYEGESLRHFERRMREAKRAGNPWLDPGDNWLDLAGAGVADVPELYSRVVTLLKAVEFDEDVYQFGLRGRLDPVRDADIAAEFLEARRSLRERLQRPDVAALVDPFDPARYNKNMTVAENLLFGTAVGPDFAPENLANNEYLRTTLRDLGLGNDLVGMGRKIAETMVEIFADLPPGHPFFEQYAFISFDDLPMYRELIQRTGRLSTEQIQREDRFRFVRLTFPYIEARHRLDLIDTEMEEKLLQGRHALAQNLPENLKKSIEFYDPEAYNSQASVQDNILFGRLVYGQAQAAQKIGRVIAEVLDGMKLRPRVIEVGLDYNVGPGGKRLSTAQRQRASLVRALVKRPRLLILNNSLAVFDDSTQRRLAERVNKIMEGGAMVLITDNVALARLFDRVIIMKEGRVIEQGEVRELDRDGSRFRELVGTVAAAAE